MTYWHVELAAHTVLYAEGVPAESYLDTGNRGAFANGGAVDGTCIRISRGGVWEARGLRAACAEWTAARSGEASVCSRAPRRWGTG